MELLGIHHVSILTGMAERNYQFYTQVLGMRLIKKTVNQDDTTSYHLFYGDAQGNPGTDLTFFDIPHLGKGVPGASSISSTSLRVKTTDSLRFWQQRFKEKEVDHDEIVERAGRQTLAFRDQEGTRLILVAEDGEIGVAGGVPWPQEEIPSEHAIVGLGAVTLTVNDPTLTVRVLTEVMGFRKVGTYPSLAGEFAPIEVYATGAGGIGAEVHIEARPDLDRERLGRGGVHHVAFRVPNSDEYEKWVERLNAYHLPNSGKVDRHYFQALYFREPNHILFELSTDTPGFATDESLETLGETLALPPFLEPKRAAIEARLRPLEI
ncbi:ring-cleaving dioxygenase [Exiguobacterium acetylicum]|uniref:ring-cleaving dioxygenase n=1 Tax=Exiguobacterium acetylicum TaxID=41170 RepID=UPI0039778260